MADPGFFLSWMTIKMMKGRIAGTSIEGKRRPAASPAPNSVLGKQRGFLKG
jgi:hypothetical protein